MNEQTKLELMPDGRPKHYITVTQGMSGHFAVDVWWNPEMGGFREPWNSGIGRYETREQAVAEAREWGAADNMEVFVEGDQ